MRAAMLSLIVVVLSAGAARGDERLDFYEKKIRPVLVERCYGCHSAKTSRPKAGLRVDRRADLLAGGDAGPAVTPGKPDESLLLRAVEYAPGANEMPPDGQLTAAVRADLRRWIAEGAVMPEDAGPADEKPRPVDVEAGRGFWSFQPLRRQPAPPVKDAGWPHGAIDPFVLAPLEQEGFRASPEAGPRALLRRLSFDLIGLPPTYDDVREFAEDDRPDAYLRRLDRQLASPRYGERWARHWLDVTRYAEDNPTSESTCKPPRFPFRYRDWVVEALDDDLPYDEFVRRQLAADLMDVPPEQLAALGLLGLSPVYHKEPKLSADVIAVIVADEWDERLDTLTRGLLGLTVACARCHDHKFDPIRTADYYAMAGVLASTQLVEWPLERTSAADAERLTETQRQVVDTELRFDYAKKMRETAKREGRDETQFAADAEREEKKLKELKDVALFGGPIANAVRDAGLWIDGNDPSWTLLDYRPGQARDLPIFVRGNPATPGPIAPRGFLQVLSRKPAGADTASPRRSASGRLELAEAITTDAAPLTARVMVNRVWSWHFDRGLVATPSNFGRLGERPTHPELLDDLSARFVEAGWSLKWLHREILSSATWRQASSRANTTASAVGVPLDVDPDNRRLGRMTRRRLEPEPWRDALLATADRLDLARGGPSQNLDDAKNRRRAIYGTISRQKPADLLRLFDFPDAKSHCETRLTTTTPLQQLYLLNSPLLQQHATEVARGVRATAGNGPEARVRGLFRRILARDPSDAELAEALELVAAARSEASGAAAEGEAVEGDATEGDATSDKTSAAPKGLEWAILAHSLLATNEFLYVD